MILANFVFVWVDQSLLLQFPVPVVPVLIMVQLRHLGLLLLPLLLVLLLLALVGQLPLGELLLDQFQVPNKAPVLLKGKLFRSHSRTRKKLTQNIVVGKCNV